MYLCVKMYGEMDRQRNINFNIWPDSDKQRSKKTECQNEKLEDNFVINVWEMHPKHSIGSPIAV